MHSAQSGSCSVLFLLFYPGSSFFLVSDHVWCQQNTWSVCLIFSHHIWGFMLYLCWASLVAQLVKNLLAMRETWVRSLGWKDPLEKGKATHSVFWPREFLELYNLWGLKKSDMTEQLSLHCWSKKRHLPPVFLPENPMDRGTWQATVHGVTESDTTEPLSKHA